MDVVSKAVDLISVLSRCEEKHNEIFRVARFSITAVSLLREYMESRVTTNNPLNDALKSEILVLLLKMGTEAQKILNFSKLSKAMFWASGLLGGFGSVNRSLSKMKDYTNDLSSYMDFVKMNVLANNNDLLYRFSGVYDLSVITNCREFWFMMFGTKQTVPLEVFKDCLISLTKCDSDVALHISCVLADNGHVFIDTFRDSVPENIAFDINQWVVEQQTIGWARTVFIPAHVSKLTCLCVISNTIVTASADCTLKLFDIGENNGRLNLRSVLIGHESSINCCVPFKKGVLSLSQDNTFRHWDLNMGECKHIYKVDHVVTLCSWHTKDEILVCIAPSTGYSLMFYDFKHCCFKNKVNVNTNSIRGMCLAGSDSLWISCAKHLSLYSYNGRLINRIQSINKRFVKHLNMLIFSTQNGIEARDSVSGAIIHQIDFPNSFSVLDICIENDCVLIFGTRKQTSSLMIVSPKDWVIHQFEFYLSEEDSVCTHAVKRGDIVYFATKQGNLYWYNMKGGGVCAGHTCNDQVKVGLGHTNVSIATSPGSILISNHGKVTKWSVEYSKICMNTTLPFAVVDCVFHNGNYVICSATSVYWFETDTLNCVFEYRTNWCLQKIISYERDLFLVYNDCKSLDSRSSLSWTFMEKNIAIWNDEESLFTTLDGIKFNNVLFSDEKNLYVSHINHILSLDRKTYRVVSKHEHQHIIAISGCKLGEFIYTLHSDDVVIIWRWSFSDLLQIKTCSINENIINLHDFNKHIIGLSTDGVIYVYNERMHLKKCILTHASRAIWGTPMDRRDDIDILVVNDEQGVIKVLAELYSVDEPGDQLVEMT